MAVRIFYVDESYDKEKFCLSAISIRHSLWRECFEQVRNFRQRLKTDFGIYLKKEIHAHKFLAGRGHISPGMISKWQRSRIFNSILQLVASLPEVYIFNVCLNYSDHADPQMTAWDRLINRIERTLLEAERKELPKRKQLLLNLKSSLSSDEFAYVEKRMLDYSPRAIVIADEGRELQIQRAIRKMHVFNPIPSQFGSWDDGRKSRSITIERVIEDPVFKQSDKSYFIQLADCVAYALLKKETEPVERIRKYGIQMMFDANLSGVCFRKASTSDPLGIVRK